MFSNADIRRTTARIFAEAQLLSRRIVAREPDDEPVVHRDAKPESVTPLRRRIVAPAESNRAE